MAEIGLEYVVCAPYKEESGVASYDEGEVITQAIKADLSINLNEATLYADNRIAEMIREFKDGKLTLNGSYLEYKTRAMLFGHTIVDENGTEELIAKGDDNGAYVGTGFFATTIRNNISKYRAIWLTKLKYGVPNESMETKADSIKFGTPAIEGTIMTDINGVWKQETTVDTKEAAIDWLNEKANIVDE